MPIVNNKKDGLKNAIFQAFSDNNITKPMHISSGPYPPVKDEPKEIHDLFFVKRWEDLNSEFFLSSGAIQNGIGFLNFQAFLYYLPSMLLFILSDSFNTNSACLLDNVMERIEDILKLDIKSSNNILTDDSKRVIRDFVEYMKSNPFDFFGNTI